MNSTKIQQILRAKYNHDYVLENQYIFYWESDYFGITKTGYVWEIEVKISVSDFRADFQKNFKHRCLMFNKQQHVSHVHQETVIRKKTGNKIEGKYGRMIDEYIDEPQGYCLLQYGSARIPNRFYYAVPSELVEKIKPLVPKYAGLLSITNKGQVIEVKNAPLLHKKKMLEELKTKLLTRFYWLSERQRIELKQRQRRLDI